MRNILKISIITCFAILGCSTDLLEGQRNPSERQEQSSDADADAGLPKRQSQDDLTNDKAKTEEEDALDGQSQQSELSKLNGRDVKNVILVPGAASSPFLASLATQPLDRMKKNLEAAGYDEVAIATYDNFLNVSRKQMEDTLTASLKKIMKSGKRYHIIGHSMGHYVAMVAVIKGKLSPQVATFIGLAGAASGGSEAPMGCGSGLLGFGGAPDFQKCPAMNGLISGRSDYVIADFKKEHAEKLKNLKKCSVAIKDDSFLKPADSGFFDDGENTSVTFARHDNIPASDEIIGYLQKHCGI